ncbi:hypothetical protein [Turicibacter sanguinis]|uniref:hypothetical protein n=1 Tax=Turicibacter sanguinis TaxID=154288 RepID=UPI001897ECE7|nr:hypothetical protein [Turicibacter sanguinis]
MSHLILQSVYYKNSYLNETSGLTMECIIKLTANMGQLYRLIHIYSDAMYNYLEAIHLVDCKLHLVIY